MMDNNKFEEYEAIISSLPDLVFVITESGRIVAVLGGDSLEQYHNCSVLENFSILEILPDEQARWFIDKIKETLSKNKLMIFEYSFLPKNMSYINHSHGPGGELRLEGRVTPLKSYRYGERAVVWVVRNITESYKLKQQLIHQAETDPLSMVYNRRKLFKALDESYYNFKRYKENIVFFLIDIDNFKQVNDKYGHQAGDSVIRNIAQKCKAELRKTDLISRIGGDEFGIIYRGTTEKSYSALSKRLNKAAQSITIDDKNLDLTISISIGISQFKESDNSVDDIYNRADIALYKSKLNGKNMFSLV